MNEYTIPGMQRHIECEYLNTLPFCLSWTSGETCLRLTAQPRKQMHRWVVFLGPIRPISIRSNRIELDWWRQWCGTSSAWFAFAGKYI